MSLKSLRPVATACLLAVPVVALLLATSLTAQNRNTANNNNNNNAAQPAPSANRNNELRSIDVKANKVADEFVKGAVDLARDYERAGDIERSIQLLEAVMKIQPELDAVAKKIDELKEQVLSANDYKMDMEIDGTWGKPLGYVRAGKPFRLEVTGTYSLSTSVTVGPQGFPTGDNIQTEMLANVPCGSVAGLVVAKERQRDGERDNPGEPFNVGEGTEIVPKDSGYLFLKVNVPPGSKCRGKLNVRLSGYILSPDLNNIGTGKR